MRGCPLSALRRRHEFVAAFLLAWTSPGGAGEPVDDPATALLPADAYLVVRYAPAERIDAVGREIAPLPALLGEERPTGEAMLTAILGDVAASVDRTRPFYFAARPGGRTEWLFHPREGTGAAALPPNVTLVGGIRGPKDAAAVVMLRLCERGADAPRRERPLPLVDGDFSVVFPVQELVDRHPEEIGKAARAIDDFVPPADAPFPVPPAAVDFGKSIARGALATVLDVQDLHYALTLRRGKLESEGWIRSRKDSALARWLGAGGAPAPPNELIDLLPDRGFWMSDSGGRAWSIDADIAAALDGLLGEGAGRAALLLFSPAYALHDHVTGRGASVILVQGLSASTQSIHEGKPGLAEAAAALDVADANRAFERLGLPISLEVERDVAKSGETRIHCLRYRVDAPQLAAVAGMMTTYFAVERGNLLVVKSLLAETEMRGLIERVRSGERKEHPHRRAMARLMPDRHEGISFNLGALKPVLGMAAMFAPEAAQVLTYVPDDLWLSTALAVRDGHIHIRGDWPLLEIAAFAERVQKER